MTTFEFSVFLAAGIFAGLSLGAAVAASRYYATRSKQRLDKQMSERRSSAMRQLQTLQSKGLLIIEDEALEAALYWEKVNPDQLEKLVHAVHTFIEEEGLEPGTDNPLALVGVHRETRDSDSKMRETPRRVQLIAGFG